MKTLILCLCLCLIGCGTIISHQAGSRYTVSDVDVFKGVATDVCILQSPIEKTSVKILAVADLPLSACADLILFPVEAVTMWGRLGTETGGEQ